MAAGLPPCRKKGSPCFSLTGASAPHLTVQREGEWDLRAGSMVQLISWCSSACSKLLHPVLPSIDHFIGHLISPAVLGTVIALWE